MELDCKEFPNGFLVDLSYSKQKIKTIGEKVGEKVTKNQELIINFINLNNMISARELAVVIDISQRKIEENILKLKKAGMLKRHGPAKGGYWEIIS